MDQQLMMVSDLADVLRATGLQVFEVPGWTSRTRPGGLAAVHGVTCHHTASGRTTRAGVGLQTVIEGRSDLEGPLAQIFLSRDGGVHVVAAGKANHAGVSLKTDYENSWRLGIEAQAAGDGWDQDWPDVQMDAYVRVCAALVVHYGFGVDQVLGHKETCAPPGRKTDPSFDMDRFRARVRAQIEEDDDMPTADQIADALMDRLTTAKVVPSKGVNGATNLNTVVAALGALIDKDNVLIDDVAEVGADVEQLHGTVQ